MLRSIETGDLRGQSCAIGSDSLAKAVVLGSLSDKDIAPDLSSKNGNIQVVDVDGISFLQIAIAIAMKSIGGGIYRNASRSGITVSTEERNG